MLVGIVGAGCIGCYVGGRLLQMGADVIFNGRPSVKKNMDEYGLTVSGNGTEEYHCPKVKFTTEISDVKGCDVIVIATKSLATAQVASDLQRLYEDDLDALPSIVSLQNGIENVPVLVEKLGEKSVFGGMVGFNVIWSEDKHSYHQATQNHIMVQHREDASIVHEFVDLLNRSGVPCNEHKNIRGVQLTKLVVNCNNALNALRGIPLREQLMHAESRYFLANIYREAIAVLSADGAVFEKVMPLHVSWAPTMLSLPTWLFSIVASKMIAIDPTARSSMYDDLCAGRMTEIDFLNGAIVDLGRTHGIPTPCNKAVVKLIKKAEQEGSGSPMLAIDQLLDEARA